jgi:hypothetical protein
VPRTRKPPAMPEVRHPKADPKCEACRGKGWFVSYRDGSTCHPEFNGRHAVERCDECLWHGEKSKKTVWDDDIARMLAEHGVKVRSEYPCVLLEQDPVPPEPARSGGFVGDWVMTNAQYVRLPAKRRRRWVWEIMRDRGGKVMAFGKPRPQPE